MNKIQIRELSAEDAPPIRRIYADIIQKPADEDFNRIIENHAGREEDICVVAVLDDNVVGFMISYILTMGFGISKSAWIATLGVNPKYMGQGIGELMAREIFSRYKSLGIENVYTSVRWNSTDLLSFFKTLGFDRSNFINLRKVLE
ncbi:MAG: GNAT family N-acetyltransferase [Thermodesulfobacteriota bacterium]|nr:GNAT family N-acetyltransferase [Thermodesulfobacteriota bacterium]